MSEPETFKNRKAAHDWLQDQGYQVSIGKFYTDIKRRENNAPALNPDQTLSRYQVALYGLRLGREQAPPDLQALAADRVDYAHAREKAEAEIAELKAGRMRREQDRDWLHADTAWAVVAGFIGSSRDVLRRHFHDAQHDLVAAAGGDPVRAPELYEACEQVIGRAYNDLARVGMDLRFAEDADDQDAPA